MIDAQQNIAGTRLTCTNPDCDCELEILTPCPHDNGLHMRPRAWQADIRRQHLARGFFSVAVGFANIVDLQATRTLRAAIHGDATLTPAGNPDSSDPDEVRR